MALQDIRWKQRFENYGKALAYLEQALAIAEPDIIQKAGIIQFFEMSFELAWKLLKDYEEAQGFVDVKSPRSAIKTAFELGIIAQPEAGMAWLELLMDRNLAAHTYDELKATELELLIRDKYFPLLVNLRAYFQKQA
jgi:nucleotidyltransferase substrate binding protein (TIGR01987 family)